MSALCIDNEHDRWVIEMKEYPQNKNLAKLWCIATLACLLVVLGSFLYSGGSWIDNWFFYDTRDSGMDFFNSIEYVNGAEPYQKYHTLYPPLANAFFSVICRCVPKDLRALWPQDFETSVLIRGTDLDLRTYQAPAVAFGFYSILVIAAFLNLFESWAAYEGRWIAKLAAFCALFSYGALYGLERGNIIIAAFLLTAFFILKRQDENRLIKELALLSLSVAAGFKLYPAAFGLLLLKDRDYKAAARTIIYGVAALFLPFLFYKEKLGGLKLWLETLFSFSGSANPKWAGNSFSAILYHISALLEKHFGILIADNWFSIAGYAAALLLCVAAFLLHREWESLLALLLAVLLYSPQADYVYVFALFPLFELFREEAELSCDNALMFICLAVLTLPLPILYRRDLFYPRSGLMQIAMVLSCLWIPLRIVKQLKAKRLGVMKS